MTSPARASRTLAQVVTDLGIPATRLRRWREHGLVVPSARSPKGGQHRYTDADLRRLRLLRVLLEHGVSTQRAGHLLDPLHREAERMVAIACAEAQSYRAR